MFDRKTFSFYLLSFAFLSDVTSNSVNNENNGPWYDKDYKELTNNITTIDWPKAHNSFLILINSNCFSLANNKEGMSTIAAGIFGTGRYFVLPRYEFTIRETSSELTKLLRNAVEWLGQGASEVIVGSNTPEPLFQFPNTIVNVSPLQLSTSKINVYKVNGHSSFTTEEIEAILTFVRNGGGLIVAAQAWSFSAKDRVLRFPGNQITGPLGVIISDYDWSHGPWTVTSSMKPEHNLYYAVLNSNDSLSKTLIPSQISTVIFEQTVHLSLVSQIVNALSDSYKSFDTVDKRSFCSLVKHYLYIFSLIKDFDWSIVKRANDVSVFPYDVDPKALKTSKSITIMGKHGNLPNQFLYASSESSLLMSTGLYAPPGSIISFTFPSNMIGQVEVSIGCHTDSLYGLSSLARSPEIVHKYSVSFTKFNAVNPWGGLIYVNIAPGSNYDDFTITIDNGVNAPYFILGTTTDEEWNSVIKNYPAPWTELEAPGNLILTIPSSVAKTLSQPNAVMEIWNKVMTNINAFSGFPNDKRERTERLVTDIQIGGGYMHAGYPIMGQLDLPPGLINLQELRTKGSWGAYHEIGHNHQWKSWTVDANSESCNNLWASYVNQKMFNTKFGHPALKNTPWRLIDFSFNGRPKNWWNGWLALDSYTLLGDKFGWSTLTSLFVKYYSLPEIRDGDEKLDTWARLFSQQVNQNLLDYFDWFRFPISNATRNILKNLPQPSEDLLVPYKIPVFTTSCPTDWFPYGDSCFKIFDEPSTWSEAQRKCTTMAGASLSSCLTLGESEYISSKTRSLGSIYIGISNQLSNNNTYYNLDHSLADENTIKWSSGYPRDGINQCGYYDGSQVRNMPCSSKAKYMCKLGPTSCSSSK